MHPYAPALLRALGFPTEQQGQQLVTKTDAQQLVAALVALEQILLEGLNPGIAAERIRLAASHQISIELLTIGRIVPLHHVVDTELRRHRLLSEQLLEHAAITLVLIDQFRAENVSF